jgi:lysozyme
MESGDFMTIKLIDAIKFNKNTPEQLIAWEYLQQNVAPDVLTEFEKLYRIKSLSKKVTNSVPTKGVELIKEFEGCHLQAYPDPLSGNLPITIGWGTTRRKDGSAFRLGDKITQAQADELLISQIEKEFLPTLSKIPYWSEMSDGKRAALLSFSYNLGADFYGSADFSTISARLKNREWDKVPDALYLYRNPGSNVEAGLARRRKAEGKLWVS